MLHPVPAVRLQSDPITHVPLREESAEQFSVAAQAAHFSPNDPHRLRRCPETHSPSSSQHPSEHVERQPGGGGGAEEHDANSTRMSTARMRPPACEDYTYML